MSPRSGRDFLTIPDVAAQLGVSRSTVHRLIKSGQLKAVPWGVGSAKPRVRVLRSEVDRYLYRVGRGEQRSGSVRMLPSPPPCGCACGREIRVAPSVLAVGPITCGVCGAGFTPTGQV